MGNCLKTKLKAPVSNNNLPVLDCISFDLTVNTVYNSFKFTGASKAFIVGNGYFTDSTGDSNLGKESNTPYNYLFVKGADDAKMYVSYKYNLTEIRFTEQNLGRTIKENSTLDLSYCSSLTDLLMSKHDTNVHLDLNKFTETNHVITFIRQPYNPLLVGDIETMVENMIHGGRASGDLVIGALNSGIRLNKATFMTGLSEYIKITFNSATNVMVHQKEDGSGALLASWDGTTWTYNS